MAKTALIDTIPATARNQGSVNLGFEIVVNHYKPDIYQWRDLLGGRYDLILFNIFYPTHIFNMIAFLKSNGIPVLASERKARPLVIVGGQGVSNLNGCLDLIVDEVYKGEIDSAGSQMDDKGWTWAEELTSPLVVKGKNNVIELTRGCKYKCKFCEYSWVAGGRFRWKDTDLVKAQVETAWNCDRRNINFLSANINSHPDIEDLVHFCDMRGIRFTNTDSCLRDMFKSPLVGRQGTVKVGIESFDEETRKRIAKPVSDAELLEKINRLVESVSYIHFYLIYGLPGDRYEEWIRWLGILGDIRKAHTKVVPTLFGEDVVNKKNLRFEFSLTNFEPCTGTPFENEAVVDFSKKAQFLDEWGQALIENGFYRADKIDYGNCRGRFGRKEESYELLMKLKKCGIEITDAIINSFPNGVGRTIKDEKAAAFLEMC